MATYTVRAGDSLWAIGARYNVGAWSVMWSNGLEEDSLILPGQRLRIPPCRVGTPWGGGTLDSIAQRYTVDPAGIVDFNGPPAGPRLQPDQVLVVPGGSPPDGARPVAHAGGAPGARPQSAACPSGPPPRPPRRRAPRPRPSPSAPRRLCPRRPPRPPAPAPTGRLSWPTRGLITTYFSGWHGIDFAARLRHPNRAQRTGAP